MADDENGPFVKGKYKPTSFLYRDVSYSFMFNAIDTLRDLNHSAIKNNFRLNVWLPTEFGVLPFEHFLSLYHKEMIFLCAVGKVIGAKGAVIQHIQRETSTRVVILPTLDQQPLWSPFTITGDPNKVLIAYNLLKSIVEGESVDNVLSIYLSFYFFE